jgi:hypothetical protein
MMELESGTKLHNSSACFFSLFTPLSVVLSRFEEEGEISKIGDIWIPKGYVSQPHFEGVVRSPLTLPKMGLESPPGLLKTQSAILGVKTPHIEAFFIPLERS